MRRMFFGVLAMLLFLPLSLSPALAAQDTGGGLADAGLPELEITATTSEFTGMPDELEAGRYLITLTVESDVDFGAGVEFMQPSGISAEEFIEFLSGPPDTTAADVAADATPFPDTATPVATPVDEEAGMDAPPDFYYESQLAGGVAALAGDSGRAVVDLTPGEWIAWGGDPFAQQAPLVFEVTGEMPADLAEPEAGATITMDEYEIVVSDGELTTGTQVVRVENVGDQPHFIIVARGPETMTNEQIEVVLDEEQAAFETGEEPEWSDLNPDEDLEFVLFTGTQSTGVTTWLELELDAGMYVLVCFVQDQEDGEAHAYHGMYTVLEVTD
jgi:hypothetical protein